MILVLGFVGYSIFVSQTNAKGALQITSEPVSTVYLDGKEIGKTPLCICGEDTVTEEFQAANLSGLFETTNDNLLPTGEYTIRLVPVEKGFSEFQDTITIGKSVLTVVDRTFGKGAASDGSVIMLEKIGSGQMELSVVSIPDGANVFLDGKSVGQAPIVLTDITESDHELELLKSGYVDKGVRIKTVMGYRLIARIYLGVDEASITGREKTDIEETNEDDTSSDLESENALGISTVLILQTGTGFLRVRDAASLAGAEIGRVSPGESYPLLSEQTSWFQIEFEDGQTGWISSEFAEKNDEEEQE